MEANERLYQKLVEGYRMDSPEYATKEMWVHIKKFQDQLCIVKKEIISFPL